MSEETEFVDGVFTEAIHADAQKTNHRPWIATAFGEAFRFRFDGTIDHWAHGRLKIPSSTRYPVYIREEAPWLLEPFVALSDPNVRRVDFRGPAGCAKSLVGEIYIAYVVDNDPGLTYYVHQKDDAAKDAMEDRVTPMFEQNEFLASRMPTEPNKKRTTKIVFPTMSFYALGANYNNAQSKRVKHLIMEEPHTYEAGLMSAFNKRVEGVRNAKILTLSTGSIKDDESDTAHNEGTCEEWHVECPHCQTFQPMTDARDRLRSDRTAETVDLDGDIIWHKLLPTVRYNCVSCSKDWPTDEAFRRKQAQSGKYVVTNTNADPSHRSFHLEALSVHWMRLDLILQEKLKASFAARRGSTELLKDYIQKRKASAWDESPPDDLNNDASKMAGAYVMAEMVEPKSDEIARFMTVDNQHGRSSKGEGAHRWVKVRAYFQGESRLVFCGRVTSWEDVEETRIKYHVEPGRTLVDQAWDTAAVQAQCVRYGWLGLWGDPNRKDSFPHYEMVANQRVIRQYPFSTVQLGTVGMGLSGAVRQARYFFWAHKSVKTLYHRLKGRMVTYLWTVPQDCPEVYFEHIKNEFKRQEIDAAGNKVWTWYNPPAKPNHLIDTDQMNLVAALLDPRIRAILLSSYEQQDTKNSSENKPDGGVKNEGHEALGTIAVPG